MIKDELLAQRGWVLVRIRDPRAEAYPESIGHGPDLYILNRRTDGVDDDLACCIRTTFQLICQNAGIPYVEPDIDLRRDLGKVLKIYDCVVPKERSLAIQKPKSAAQLDGNIAPEHVFANSNFPYPFKHEDKKTAKWHFWIAMPNNIHNDGSCPVCRNQFLQTGVNDFQTLYPELMSEWNTPVNEANGIFPDRFCGAPGRYSTLHRASRRTAAAISSRISRIRELPTA